MSVGSLSAKVVLDDPKHIYCGNEEAVTGHVLVRYHSTSSAELFGPLSVSVTFRGRAKSKIYKNNGNNRTIYRGRAPLFSFSKSIFDGPIKMIPNEAKEIPFALSFPSAVQQMLSQGNWDADGRFSIDVGDPLPPTFNIVYHGFAHRFDAFTEYRIGTTLSMRGIDIKLPNADDESNSVLVPYEQQPTPISQALPLPKTLNYNVRLQNALLMPESSRPTGFKAKTKALLSSDYYPEYHFDVLTLCPQKLFLGQPITLEIRIQPNEARSTAPVRPDITIPAGVLVSIQAQTVARAERGIFSSPESSGNETVLTLTASSPDLQEPFGKSNDWTKVVVTKPLFGVPSGFSTYNILRRYTVKVSFSVLAAGKSTKVEKELSVMILPPVEGEVANGDHGRGANMAGPSRHVVGEDDAEVLPGYERPPEYGDDHSIDEVESAIGKMDLGKGKASDVAV
ncbi:hypothetical protein B0A48_05481 [Cryoendolithus antarcticus]|uniref:Arrestin-like N-terminal domain-containing protein n=1 Tax=Cryoendolithus antarcticus TaxID=1507870 RepID=A0A1V8TIL7_9PEZI|nr:hypothetical protein B0A48_05481 [Cryoendolithus antarcticus]